MSASVIEPRGHRQLRRTHGELGLNIRDVDTHAIGVRAQRWIVKRSGSFAPETRSDRWRRAGDRRGG
jgi:hypothetical protein